MSRTDEDNQVVAMLNVLREEEGAYVTVLCPNPDSDPAQAVLVFGEWTGWNERRFVGGSLLEALSAAIEAMLEPAAGPGDEEAFPLPDAADRFLGAMVSLSAFGVSDSDILSALIGSAATSLGLILEEDPGFLERMRENRPPLEPALAVDQVLDGLAEIHRRNAEKMAEDAAAPR